MRVAVDMSVNAGRMVVDLVVVDHSSLGDWRGFDYQVILRQNRCCVQVDLPRHCWKDTVLELWPYCYDAKIDPVVFVVVDADSWSLN